MADILIRGMEMPGNNNTVLFCVVDGKMKATSFDRIHDGFHEVIEIPEHGRLIDADALKENLRTVEFWNGSEQVVSEQDINDALTIVPAEGGGEE